MLIPFRMGRSVRRHDDETLGSSSSPFLVSAYRARMDGWMHILANSEKLHGYVLFPCVFVPCASANASIPAFRCLNGFFAWVSSSCGLLCGEKLKSIMGASSTAPQVTVRCSREYSMIGIRAKFVSGSFCSHRYVSVPFASTAGMSIRTPNILFVTNLYA